MRRLVTFLILLFAILAIGVMAVLALGAGGIVIFAIFGDVIIAEAIIYLIIRAILRRRSKRKTGAL